MIGNSIGKLGEDIASLFLKKHSMDVFTRNYSKKWGEIDLIGSKEGITHFIEVKTVTRENLNDISRVTPVERRSIRPEENLHDWKLKRLSRVIRTYLISHKDVTKWQFDVCIVYLVIETKQARVKFLENIVLPE